ncbi:polysaccharide deacetylase family protein [Mesorhizobium sp. PUT5]|uniref:polysaccharide deacetylase family protein n=1 Tax=Mesorhizobium sp. PUT5 TaxID=3454629 RepID=UPI003FA47123
MVMTPRERIAYSAIVDRPALDLPDGVRMPVWVIVNVENWDIRRPMPRAVLPPPMGNPLVPDVPNWAWHEYGMRVGFWRLMKALKRRAITPTLATNGSVCEVYPRVVQAAHDEGWEFMGHGWLQGPMHALEDQAASIARTIEAIRAITGKAPRGWESPGLTETADTVDLLSKAGIEYVADWVLDDQPCMIETASGPIVSVPYTVEINDVSIMAVAQHSSDEFLKRGIRQFDRLYAESQRLARIMSISVHPYLSGVPHRIGYFEELLDHVASKPGVVFWTGEQILDWFTSSTQTNRS